MSEERIDPGCRDEERRDLVRNHPTANGIDFVEFFQSLATVPQAFWLIVTFLKKAPPGLTGHPERFQVEGGARITGIAVTAVEEVPGHPLQLKVSLNASGDFSWYTLQVEHAGLDARLSSARFRFKSDCPTGVDCRTEVVCPPSEGEEPLLDYQAKDYASFLRLLLDLIPQRNPRWVERNAADLGMVLVELLAHAGDRLSYYQDAVSTEMFLDTCRQRQSARRHALLIDHRVHEGRNAWGFVHLKVDSAGSVGAGAMLLTRIGQALKGQNGAPGTIIDAADLPDDFGDDPALKGAVAFETTAGLDADPANNTLYLHTWGDRGCCLPEGSTGITLFGVDGDGNAYAPPLKAGDYLLLEEVKGTETGERADADEEHRQVVRLAGVEAGEDPVFSAALEWVELNGGDDGEWRLVPSGGGADPVLPVLSVTWEKEDALSFPLCISSEHESGWEIHHVAVARGNVVPCDHGRTVKEKVGLPRATGGLNELLELEIPGSPVTFEAIDPGLQALNPDGTPAVERHGLDLDAREAQPAVILELKLPGGEKEVWTPVPDLLASDAHHRHFVVEVGNDGQATLRFGDGEYGKRPPAGSSDEGEDTGAVAIYRIGNGTAGNLGSGKLAHIVRPSGAGGWPGITEVLQPLPADGGVDRESIEEVRQHAPRAFHAEQFRAVTEADYEGAALKADGVGAAKCTFRWTGSWHTAFVGIHPEDPGDLVTEAGGRAFLSEELARGVRDHLDRYRLAGYDLEIRAALYVPLEVAVDLCVAQGHFRGDVLKAVRRILSNQQFEDGTVGFFHPSRFAFGQSVYLSQLYAEVEAVQGVESAVVTTFKRFWEDGDDELDDGVISMGMWEIARLDNDPNFRENGVLSLRAMGGL